MKNFRLIYERGNTGNLVVPQMLPEDTPKYKLDPTGDSLMQFRYDRFMPSGTSAAAMSCSLGWPNGASMLMSIVVWACPPRYSR